MSTFLGIDWKDVGINAFSGAHYGGKILASSFGGGALVAPVENLQSRGGLLKDWARSDGGTSAPPQITVSNPEAFVLVRANGTIEQPVSGAASVVITGGKRLEGDGRFSFGYDGVQQIDITMKSGAKASGIDIKTILFKGGTEAPATTSVKGDDMSANAYELLGEQIVGELEAIETTGEFTEFDYQPEQIFKNTYLHGTDIIGASAQPQRIRAGFVKRTTPRGRTFVSLVVTPRKGDSVASVKNARDVGQRAIAISNLITQKLNRLPTTVKGLAPKRQMKRQMTLAQLKKLAAEVGTAGNNLLVKGAQLDNALGVGLAKEAAAKTALLAKMFKSKAKRTLATGLRKNRGTTMTRLVTPTALRTAASSPVRTAGMRQTVMGADRLDHLGRRADREGYDVMITDPYEIEEFTIGQLEELNTVLGQQWEEIVGAQWEEIVGARTWADGTPMTPEEETRANAEDAAFAGTGPVPSSSPSSSTPAPAPSGEASYSSPSYYTPVPGPEANYGVPAFSAANINYAKDLNYQMGSDPATDRTLYNSQSMPLPGIIFYQGERGLPRDRFGSWERYYGPSRAVPHGGNGYYWSANEPPVEGQGWGRRLLRPDGGFSDYGVPADYLLRFPTGMEAGGGSTDDWGPLVGAPNDWTKGLRFDMGSKQWFWFWDQAPEWATGKVIRTAELVQQAKLDYEVALTSAKAAYLEQQAQDKLDEKQSRELAREAAQNAANMATVVSQADQAEVVSSQKLAQQYAKLDAQYAQMQQQAETTASQALSQQQAMDLQEQKMMLDYFAQNPSAMFAQGDEGGGDEGADWGGGDAGGGEVSEENVDWGTAAEGGEGEITADEMMSELSEG